VTWVELLEAAADALDIRAVKLSLTGALMRDRDAPRLVGNPRGGLRGLLLESPTRGGLSPPLARAPVDGPTGRVMRMDGFIIFNGIVSQSGHLRVMR
jgi:hypothetical protein